MTETNEERLVRLETRSENHDLRWLDHVKRTDEQRDEMLEWLKGIDNKVDSLLLREAGRDGERREHRNIVIKIASFVSLIVGGVVSAVINTFR